MEHGPWWTGAFARAEAPAGSLAMEVIMTEADIMAGLDRAFAGVRRPEHFTDFTHCEECREHDELLRARDRETLAVADVENPGWGPVNFLTPEGFRYYLPALARIALSAEGEGFLSSFVPFHLCDIFYMESGPERHPWLVALEPPQRDAVRRYVHHVAETRRGKLEHYGVTAEEVDRAVALWDAACSPRGE